MGSYLAKRIGGVSYEYGISLARSALLLVCNSIVCSFSERNSVVWVNTVVFIIYNIESYKNE